MKLKMRKEVIVLLVMIAFSDCLGDDNSTTNESGTNGLNSNSQNGAGSKDHQEAETISGMIGSSELLEIQIKSSYIEEKQVNKETILKSVPLKLSIDENVSGEIGVCTWFMQRQTSSSATIIALQTKTIGNSEEVFISVGISEGILFVQDHDCLINYDIELSLRTWYHMCLALDYELVTLYIDGRIRDPIESDCQLQTDSEALSERGELLVGKDELWDEYFVGHFADMRYYPMKLDNDTIQGAFDFSNGTNYIPVGFKEDQFPSNYDHSFEDIDTIFMSLWSEKMLFFFPDRINHASAIKVCSTLKGKLYENDTDSDQIAHNYVMTKTESSLVNAWIGTSNNETCKMVKISLPKFQVTNTKCVLTFSTICEISKQVQYKLIGLEQFPIKLSLIEGKDIFESDFITQVKYTNKLLVIYDTKYMETEFTSYYKFEKNKIMGRKFFKPYEEGDNKLITLSSCSDDEYTCSDGQCVALELICDYNSDCSDNSDEHFCNATQMRPKFYDNLLSGQDEIPLNLTISLNRLVDVDINDGTITLELEVNISWVDNRVFFYNLHENTTIYIPTADSRFYWQPNIILKGVVNSDTQIFALPENPGKMYVTAKSNGSASTHESYEVLRFGNGESVQTHVKSSLITMACNLNLYIYPFDVQNCGINMTLEGKVRNDAIWNSVSVEYDDDVPAVPMYSIVFFESGNLSNKNQVEIKLRIERLFGSQILLTFVPCILLQIIGLSVFAIPLDDLSDRLTVSISCLIVMAALFTQISTTLPESASVKIIDIWMMLHVCMLAAVFILQLVIHRVYLREQSRPFSIIEKKDQSCLDKIKTKLINKSTFSKTLNRILAFFSLVFYVLFVAVFFYESLYTNFQEVYE